MSTKVWTPSLRTIFVFCKSLCSGILKKFSMWVFVTMDCLKGIYNGIGIRFFMMALIKIWTLIMYVLRRNLKKVCLSSRLTSAYLLRDERDVNERRLCNVFADFVDVLMFIMQANNY